MCLFAEQSLKFPVFNRETIYIGVILAEEYDADVIFFRKYMKKFVFWKVRFLEKTAIPRKMSKFSTKNDF